MNLFTFKGGVHPKESKEVTEDKKIEKLDPPEFIYLPLLQHIGTPLEAMVKVGDKVKLGERIADSKAFLSSPIHSPVSGEVVKIETMTFPINGKIKTIVIKNDKQDTWIGNRKGIDYKKLSPKELLDVIREHGIVGQGGAAFPSHIKLNPPADKKIDTLLINAAECEPYLNADNRLMIESPKAILEGIRIILKVLKVKKAIIGIENNKKEAIKAMVEAAKVDPNISVAVLKTKYPQGGEKQLIKAVLNREVPSKKLPAEVGVVVQNVSTAKVVYDAVVKGEPLIERVLTVSGNGVKEPKNLLVRIGTQFKYILEELGVDWEKTEKLIMGGPMMGIAQYTDEVPVVKGTSGILALTKKEVKSYRSKSCISCGKCVEACPMSLMPLMYAKIARVENWEDMEEYNLMDCIECGTCAFTCPSNRPLTEAIKLGKAKLRTMKR